MPQTDFDTNDILVLTGIFVTIYFSYFGGANDESNSLDDYVDSFLQLAYYADELCFYIDENLQQIFNVVVHYTLLQKIYNLTRLDGYSYCLPYTAATNVNFFLTLNAVTYLLSSARDFIRFVTTNFHDI
jgi:hypothetical protein